MELPFYKAYSANVPLAGGSESTNYINSGTGQLGVEQAFAGVNYLQATASKKFAGGDADASLSKLLDNDGGPQSSAHSIFNKFTVFQYSGLNAGFAYQEAGHFIGFNSTNKRDLNDLDLDNKQQYDAMKARIRAEKETQLANAKSDQDRTGIRDRYDKMEKSADGKFNSSSNSIASISSNTVSNPTAKKLIDWGANNSPSTIYGFQPYSMTDFMFCKYYGRIPNNRLVTLRRYPHPVSDSVRTGVAGGDKSSIRSAIPIAQAVTWFGAETGFTLNSLGNFAWDMPWEFGGAGTKINDAQQIDGNEITLSELFSGAGGLLSDDVKNLLLSGYVSLTDAGDSGLAQLTGYDKKIQDYQKNLYTNGPYWNRIYGPVNVINETTRRLRGIQTNNWKKPFTVNFHYSFRSFNGLSPKIVALDLISNFLNLTYNDAQFLNQLSRYFPKTGVKPDPTVAEALGNLLTSWGTTFSGNSSETFMKFIDQMVQAVDKAGSNIFRDPLKYGKQTLQTVIMSRLGDAIPKLLSVKSALSDRPVGEWHITVGNPMNPIFVMGDLVVTGTEMTWDEEMGPDDFPTGCTFKVTLSQAKPRDKTAIERMLNLGDTKLTAGTLRTSSYDDTFGEDNYKLWNETQVDQNSAKTEEQLLEKARANDPKSPFSKFRSRFRNGYSLADPDGKSLKSKNFNDSVLLLYFQRNYGNN